MNTWQDYESMGFKKKVDEYIDLYFKERYIGRFGKNTPEEVILDQCQICLDNLNGEGK